MNALAKGNFKQEASKDLEYIEMPGAAGLEAEGPPAKTPKPNFFHKYQKNSEFLNSNDVNRTRQMVQFLKKQKDLNSPVSNSDATSDRNNAGFSRKELRVFPSLIEKRFAKVCRSQEELSPRQKLLPNLSGNFEFQKNTSNYSNGDFGSNSGDEQIQGYFEKELGSASSHHFQSDRELFGGHKLSDEINFSKKELSKNESLFSYSSREHEKTKKKGAKKKKKKVCAPASREGKGKKFKLELDIEKKQKTAREGGKQKTISGSRACRVTQGYKGKKTRMKNEFHKGSSKKQNPLKTHKFKNESEKITKNIFDLFRVNDKGSYKKTKTKLNSKLFVRDSDFSIQKILAGYKKPKVQKKKKVLGLRNLN